MIFRHRLSLQNARKKQNSDFDPGSTEGYPLFTEGNNASSCSPGFVIYFLLPPEVRGSVLNPWKRKAEEGALRMILDDRLIYEILSVVEEIPRGRVATYGQIARLIGRDRNARLVGKVLSMAENYGNYPCHRVVNHAGRPAPFFYEQEARLREEGVAFLPNGNVDLKRYQWTP